MRPEAKAALQKLKHQCKEHNVPRRHVKALVKSAKKLAHRMSGGNNATEPVPIHQQMALEVVRGEAGGQCVTSNPRASQARIRGHDNRTQNLKQTE
jgi:hypothetical protein